MNCKLCDNQTDNNILCDSCLRCEDKRVRFQNERKNSKHTLYLEDWIKVLEFHNYSCKGCKAKFVLLTLDHIQSLASGGLNKKENIQPLCSSCHEIKAAVETKLKGNKKKRREAKEIREMFPNLF